MILFWINVCVCAALKIMWLVAKKRKVLRYYFHIAVIVLYHHEILPTFHLNPPGSTLEKGSMYFYVKIVPLYVDVRYQFNAHFGMQLFVFVWLLKYKKNNFLSDLNCLWRIHVQSWSWAGNDVHCLFIPASSSSVDLSISEAAIFSSTSSAVWSTSHQSFHQPWDLHPASSPTFTLSHTQRGAQASVTCLVKQGSAHQPQ